MSLKTTCIGAFPKPDFVKLPDWFNIPDGPDTANPTREWLTAIEEMGPDTDAIISRGIQQVISDQTSCGIDIPTDGEVIRENYIHYHCRHLEGFDFVNLTNKEVRGGNYAANLPTIIGPISVRQLFLAEDWRRAQRFTDRPVKITMPGPMTVFDTNADDWYHDAKKAGSDIAAALNAEVLSLAEAGCRHIQIDEPLFARKPGDAVAYGFDNLERAFHGCPEDVVRTVHMCCGYPDRLDHPDYPKADPQAYMQIVDAVEDSSLDAVSFEDAHRHNDLKLLEHLKTTTAIFGVVAIARSRIEPVDEIHARLAAALEHIDAERLIAAPDCGLGLLSREQVLAKLGNMCKAAQRF